MSVRGIEIEPTAEHMLALYHAPAQRRELWRLAKLIDDVYRLERDYTDVADVLAVVLSDENEGVKAQMASLIQNALAYLELMLRRLDEHERRKGNSHETPQA